MKATETPQERVTLAMIRLHHQAQQTVHDLRDMNTDDLDIPEDTRVLWEAAAGKLAVAEKQLDTLVIHLLSQRTP